MKENNFEENLPDGYDLVFHINAKDKKTGIIFNLVAFIPVVIAMTVAILSVVLNENYVFKYDFLQTELSLLGLIVVLVVYMILHELLHGAAYKGLTGRKLTFGLSWSCAFCGVPDIFVYRKTALIALIAPFALFTVVFLPLTVALYFVNGLFYLLSALMLGLHWGGCSGDLYMTYLLLFKYKDKNLLMKDTGPEQFLYLKKS